MTSALPAFRSLCSLKQLPRTSTPIAVEQPGKPRELGRFTRWMWTSPTWNRWTDSYGPLMGIVVIAVSGLVTKAAYDWADDEGGLAGFLVATFAVFAWLISFVLTAGLIAIVGRAVAGRFDGKNTDRS